MKAIQMIAFMVLSIFALVGGTVVSVALHEYTHKVEFSGINKTNEQLCVLAYPSNGDLGYYSFATNDSTQKIVEVSKYAELEAYLITAMVILVLGLCFIITFAKFYEKN